MGMDLFDHAVAEESGARYHDGLFPVYMGLYVEMKRPPQVTVKTGSVSFLHPTPEQQTFIDFVKSQGYVAECANGQDEAIEIFTWYLNLERIPADALQNNYSHVDSVIRPRYPKGRDSRKT